MKKEKAKLEVNCVKTQYFSSQLPFYQFLFFPIQHDSSGIKRKYHLFDVLHFFEADYFYFLSPSHRREKENKMSLIIIVDKFISSSIFWLRIDVLNLL